MSYQSEVLADSPRAYYRYAEASGNPQDSSGNAMHVTSVLGSPTYQQTGVSATGDFSVLMHSAGPDHFDTPDNALLDLADVFTLEAWIKRTATQSVAQGIISKGVGAYYLRLDASNQLDLLKSQTADLVHSTTTITDTTAFHHVVATKNAGTIHLYIDSVDVTGTVSNATCVDNAIALAVGEDSGAGEGFDGNIAEVAVYATELSAARVLAHYNAGQGIGAVGTQIIQVRSGLRLA